MNADEFNKKVNWDERQDNGSKDPVFYSKNRPPEYASISEKHKVSDPINHPTHYTKHASGIECIDIAEQMNFNLGNVVKYIWRADLKVNALEDLKKAQWYLDREILRRQKLQSLKC